MTNTIENCSSFGDISQNGGGICGENAGVDGNLIITCCYSTGIIEQLAGGICGASAGYNGGNLTIKNCYSTGDILGSDTGAGGICGNSAQTGCTVINCVSVSGSSTRKYDINNNQQTGNGDPIDGDVPGVIIAATTTVSKVYNYMTSNLDKTDNTPITFGFPQVNGVDYTDAYITVDGQNHTVIIKNVSGFDGLFQNGYYDNNTENFISGQENITIKNFKIDNTDTTTLANAGGWLCQEGFSYNVTNKIENCSSKGDISDSGGGICGDYAGIGTNGNLTIINCSSSGDILNYGGGICGLFAADDHGKVTVTNCYSTGTIGVSAGGICGNQAGNSGGKVTVINCNSNFKDGNIKDGSSTGLLPMDGNYRVSLKDIMDTTLILDQTATSFELEGYHVALLEDNLPISSNKDFTFTANSVGLTVDGLNNSVTITGSGFKGLFQNGQDDVNGQENIIIRNFKIDGLTHKATLAPGGGWLCYDFFSRGVTNKIENCSSSGEIGVASGGICGTFVGSDRGILTISNCYSTGDILDWGGGICGNYAGFGGIVTISNCYSTGLIIGSNAGGICGGNAGASAGIITIVECNSNFKSENLNGDEEVNFYYNTGTELISDGTRPMDGNYRVSLKDIINFTDSAKLGGCHVALFEDNCEISSNKQITIVNPNITVDGQNYTIIIIKKNEVKFKGLFQNGYWNSSEDQENGQENITIKNFIIDGKTHNVTLAEGGGWLCQREFSKGALNNKIENCSSSGDMLTDGGGICGKDAGYYGNLSITNCYSTGQLGSIVTYGLITELKGTIQSIDTNITVMDSNELPSEYPYYVKIDNEILKVTKIYTPVPATAVSITISNDITSSSTVGGKSGTSDENGYTYFTLDRNTIFTNHITIDSKCYFKITATTGTEETPIIINGQTVTITGSGFKGLFQNGQDDVNGQKNITIKNFKIDGLTNLATLTDGGGWLCQEYFSKGVTNKIENCSSSCDIISDLGGGICGKYAGIGTDGNFTITNCYSTGKIGYDAGGICGAMAGAEGILTISNCYSTGGILTSGGGICGYRVGKDKGTVKIENCYSIGNIKEGGGICGGSAGYNDGAVTITGCYSTGQLDNNGGGICETGAGYDTGEVIVSKCYSNFGSNNLQGQVILNSNQDKPMDGNSNISSLRNTVPDEWDSSIWNDGDTVTPSYPILDVFTKSPWDGDYTNYKDDAKFVPNTTVALTVVRGEKETTASAHHNANVYIVTEHFSGGICGEFAGRGGGTVTVSNCNSNFGGSYNLHGLDILNSTEDKPMDGNYRVSLEYYYNNGNIIDFEGYGIAALSDFEITSNKSFEIKKPDMIFDGQNYTITITGNDFSGLFQNGNYDSVTKKFINGQENITIKNFKIDGSGATLAESGGWLCQQYFSYNATNNKIENCSSSGDISTYGGGICGSGAGYFNGNLTIEKCYTTGSISTDAGGICGNQAGDSGGTVTVTNCNSNSKNNFNNTTINGDYPGTTSGSVKNNLISDGTKAMDGNYRVSLKDVWDNITDKTLEGYYVALLEDNYEINENKCFTFTANSVGLTVDGLNNTVTIGSGVTFDGLFQNGSDGADGKSNIIIKNFNIDESGATLKDKGGWLCQDYFSKGVTNRIENCSSSGDISAYGGGICGSYAGRYGNLTITNCYSTGDIEQYGGGICGEYAGTGCTLTNCVSVYYGPNTGSTDETRVTTTNGTRAVDGDAPYDLPTVTTNLTHVYYELKQNISVANTVYFTFEHINTVVDGQNNTVTIGSGEFNGLFQNGYYVYPGQENITIKNFKIDGSGATLADGGGGYVNMVFQTV